MFLLKIFNFKTEYKSSQVLKWILPKTKEEAKMMKEQQKEAAKRGESLAGSSKKGSFLLS